MFASISAFFVFFEKLGVKSLSWENMAREVVTPSSRSRRGEVGILLFLFSVQGLFSSTFAM